jgi:hypothetical protein
LAISLSDFLMLSHYAVFPGIVPVWKRLNIFRTSVVLAPLSYRTTEAVLVLIGFTKLGLRRRCGLALGNQGEKDT